MIAATPIPTIPWTAWLVLIPIQIVLDAGLFWVSWWAMMKHDPDRMTPNARIALMAKWFAAATAFIFGTIIASGLALNPTRDPRIGMVGVYYWGVADIPPMLVVAFILKRSLYLWHFSPEATKRNRGVGIGEYFFPSSRPNISLREAAELAKQMDCAARGRPPKAAAPPIYHPTDNSGTDLKALERQRGVTPPPPEDDEQGGNKSGRR